MRKKLLIRAASCLQSLYEGCSAELPSHWIQPSIRQTMQLSTHKTSVAFSQILKLTPPRSRKQVFQQWASSKRRTRHVRSLAKPAFCNYSAMNIRCHHQMSSVVPEIYTVHYRTEASSSAAALPNGWPPSSALASHLHDCIFAQHADCGIVSILSTIFSVLILHGRFIMSVLTLLLLEFSSMFLLLFRKTPGIKAFIYLVVTMVAPRNSQCLPLKRNNRRIAAHS